MAADYGQCRIAWRHPWLDARWTGARSVAAHSSLGRVGRYGLGRVDGGLRLHHLTQAILRDQLDTGQATAYRAYAQALLVTGDPGDEHDPATWPGWAQFLPHLLATDPASSPNPPLRDLARRAVYYLSDRGESQTARDLAEHLHKAWRKNLGPDDPHTLWVCGLLGRLLSDLGPMSDARRLGEDTFARSKRSLGIDHPDTLQAAHWLAKTLHHAGAIHEASELNKDTLARRRQVLGEDHVRCELTALNLARDLRALGQVEEAQRLQEGTVAYRLRVFGEDHPLTINATNELGATFRALTGARRVLGHDHRFTIDAANNLAADLYALGDFEATYQLSQDILARAQHVLGDTHPLTRRAADVLVAARRKLGHDPA